MEFKETFHPESGLRANAGSCTISLAYLTVLPFAHGRCIRFVKFYVFNFTF